MYQAIETRFYGPTNHRPARVRAKCAAGVHWHEWDYSQSAALNHRDAAFALAATLGWDGRWRGGSGPDETGYFWVLEAPNHRSTFNVHPVYSTLAEG